MCKHTCKGFMRMLPKNTKQTHGSIKERIIVQPSKTALSIVP